MPASYVIRETKLHIGAIVREDTQSVSNSKSPGNMLYEVYQSLNHSIGNSPMNYS